MKVINAERDKMSMVKIFNWIIMLNIIKAKWDMLIENNVKSNKHRIHTLFNKSRVLNRREKADQLRNLAENFSNMSLKDYLDSVFYFFE